MCQMRIVLKRGGGEEVVLENAAVLKVTDEGILVNALFEQPKLIQGALVSGIDFLASKVTLIETARKARHGSENDDRQAADSSAALD